MGSGDFYNVYGVNGFHLTAGDKDYKERLEQIEEGVKEYYNDNGIPPGEPTMKGSNADPYVADVALPNAELGDYSVPTDWPTNVKFNEPGDVPGPVVQFEDDDQGDVKAGYGFESDNLYEGDWFFFHTDHLGSTSYLTDTAGNVSQFVCYTPYGEAIVDEHLTTYEHPFKFSGKELDDITGLYDHGARSRNPISTLWYGVDPLFEKYPDFSPYNYCAGNPVIFTDPDGRGKVEGEESQKCFMEDVKNVFGSENTKYFKFDEQGNLSVDESKLDLNKNQRKIFKGLKTFIESDCSLTYKENVSMVVKQNEGEKECNVNEEFGGGLYNKETNLIVISPSCVSSIDVNPAPTYEYIYENDDPINGKIIDVKKIYGSFTEKIQENRTSTLFHEIGELMYRGSTDKGHVIDYQNLVRKQIGLPDRPYDLNHNFAPLKK